MDVDMDMNTDVNVNIPGDNDDDGNRAGVSSRRGIRISDRRATDQRAAGDDGGRRRDSSVAPPVQTVGSMCDEMEKKLRGGRGGGGGGGPLKSLMSFASGDDLRSSYDLDDPSSSSDRRRAWRISMLLFVSLLCHNFQRRWQYAPRPWRAIV